MWEQTKVILKLLFRDWVEQYIGFFLLHQEPKFVSRLEIICRLSSLGLVEPFLETFVAPSSAESLRLVPKIL